MKKYQREFQLILIHGQSGFLFLCANNSHHVRLEYLIFLIRYSGPQNSYPFIRSDVTV